MKKERVGIGRYFTNEELYKTFKCGNVGGMRRSKAFNCLLITSSEDQDLYDDKLVGNTLKYTGMGKNGDQKLKGNQNITLFESRTNGVTVLFFKHLNGGGFEYRGLATLNGDPYEEKQSGENGLIRSVWVFPLVITQQDYFINLEHLDLNTSNSKRKGRSKTKPTGNENPFRRETTVYSYDRDEEVKLEAKYRAKGFCQLCDEPAPFKDKGGDPFLEVHHIEWLSKGGADTLENVVALCPNCHRKMHNLNLEEDIIKLKERII